MTDAKRAAIITGGSSGIGPALARELGRSGYRVALLARRADELASRVRELQADGVEALCLPCDVTSSEQVHAAVEKTKAAWGQIDLVIANAGLGFPTPAKRFVLEDADRIMRTNFYGTLTLFDAVIPDMLARRSGTFVGVASLAGKRGLPGSSIYSASKAAMQAFLEATRVELSPTGVRVVVVNPGFIETPMTARNRFRMLFLMSVDKAARIITSRLERGDSEINFPLPTAMLMVALRHFPNRVYDFALRGYAKRDIDLTKARR
ncbi:MAG: SDR family NAD(P)-dependent oxidoreductase [Acidobacteriota bacterium]